MATLKYLGIVFYAALAVRAETEKTPLVPLVSIRELHEDFSGKVEDAECKRKPELVTRRKVRLRRRASTPSRTSTRCWTRLLLNATRCRPIH